MKKKEFIDRNTGQDKITGRPIRLNRGKLIPNRGDYAELIFFGDIHVGYPTANIKRAKQTLEYALDNKSYVLCMGDMIEAGLTESPGDSVYRQKLNPQRQMEKVVRMLQPVADEGLIVGFHQGNHEHRITKATGIDIAKIMSKMLSVRYLGYACWSLFSVGGIRYSIYSQHGASGAKFKHTKLKAVMDQAAWLNSDVLAMGHLHSMSSEPIIKQRFDATLNKIVNEKQVVVLTGAYIEWDNSYAQQRGYPIVKIGSPKVKLVAKEKDVHVRL